MAPLQQDDSALQRDNFVIRIYHIAEFYVFIHEYHILDCF